MDRPDFKVRIEHFEGPLDLLLFLIEEQELDIYEVSLSQVTEQYLQYIYQAQSINLDIASEFLIMAARLLQLKVRRLLPSLRTNDEEEDDLANFEEDLFKQLAEYKRYKEVVSHLKDKFDIFTKYSFREIDEDKIIKEYVNDNPLENCSLEDLSLAFRRILKNMRPTDPVIEIVREQYSISDSLKEITDKVYLTKEGIRFSDLFLEKYSREKVVVTFLALLELIKTRKVKFIQNKLFSEIYILPLLEEV